MFIVDDLSTDRLDVVNVALVEDRNPRLDPLQSGSSPGLESRISIDDFLSFVRTLEGEVISTLAGRSNFTVHVVESGLEFTPSSTGLPRGHTRAYVQRVLDRFEETGSFNTTDYQFTVNASYQLTLIDCYLNQVSQR